MTYLTDFVVARPKHQNVQQYGVHWLAEAHTRAEQTAQNGNGSYDAARFRETMTRLIGHYGCGPDRIGSRGHELDDFLHTDWDKMRIFRIHEKPSGAGMEERSRFFAETAEAVFTRLYADAVEPPQDLIHVTCTGYTSPSAAQRLVEKLGWHKKTTVTHAYHMGCYASLPAVRIAAGFLAAAPAKRRADIVHTEVCTVHLNPAVHTAEQLVVQSLFADGFIRYAACSKQELDHNPRPALQLLAVHEEVIPQSLGAMTWNCVDWGMQMGLAKEVPELIASSLHSFLHDLFAQAGLSLEACRDHTIFGIHPGGPRIIDQVQAALGLRDEQVEISKRILFEYGNMSSATLPHVWDRFLSNGAPGTLLACMAFGPGLSVAGGLLRLV